MVDTRPGRPDMPKRLESKGRGKGTYIKSETWDSKWKTGMESIAEAQSMNQMVTSETCQSRLIECHTCQLERNSQEISFFSK